MVRLVRRNSEKAEDLTSFPLPECFLPAFKKEYGNIKGIFTPTQEIKDWLRKELGH